MKDAGLEVSELAGFSLRDRIGTNRKPIVRTTTLLDHLPALPGVDNSGRRILTAPVS